jgi:ABC-type uncharacterized transport system involved in gliding motility auxiliary subunit
MSMSKKKKSFASNALLYTLFVVGVIFVVNLISIRVFGRVDMTEKKIYSLSPSSRALVKNLDDPLSVKAFISTDLPPEIKQTARFVRDQLDEYKNASGGKFTWESIDPGEDKKLEEEATRCKVQKITIQVMRNSKIELGTHYLGICLQYGDKIESIPQIGRTEGLEYQISSLIKKMAVKKKKVAFTTGHGEFDLSQGFQALKQSIEQEFDVTTVNPSTAEIGADVDALVVGGPKQALDEKGQKEIDRFIMTGKGAIFLAPAMAVSSPNNRQGMGGPMAQLQMLQSNETGLGKVLEAYGFKVGAEVLVDAKGAYYGTFDHRNITTAPLFIAAPTTPNSELSLLEGVRGLVFPFASPVDLVGPLAGGKLPANGKVWPVAATSENTWVKSGFMVVTQDEVDKLKPEGTMKSYALGYAYQGPLKSAFVTAAPAVSATDKLPLAETAKPVRLVVFGNAAFASDDWTQLAQHPLLRLYGNGAQLLYNAISWIGEDEALVPLRSKGNDIRQIEAVSEGKTSAIQWINILGLPFAFCLYGVARWRIRKANRVNQKL